MECEQYPLDYATLGKGDLIDAATIEGIVGVGRDSALYSGRQVDLAHEIEKQLGLLGLSVTAACLKATIKILTDAESSAHNERLFRKGHNRLSRAHRKLLEVDQTKLDREQSTRHDRTIVVQAAILAGANDGRREAFQVIHQRSTPGLPEPDA